VPHLGIREHRQTRTSRAAVGKARQGVEVIVSRRLRRGKAAGAAERPVPCHREGRESPASPADMALGRWISAPESSSKPLGHAVGHMELRPDARKERGHVRRVPLEFARRGGRRRRGFTRYLAWSRTTQTRSYSSPSVPLVPVRGFGEVNISRRISSLVPAYWL